MLYFKCKSFQETTLKWQMSYYTSPKGLTEVLFYDRYHYSNVMNDKMKIVLNFLLRDFDDKSDRPGQPNLKLLDDTNIITQIQELLYNSIPKLFFTQEETLLNIQKLNN